VLLADAQLAIAREYGFASWPKLKQHVDSLRAESRVLSAKADRDERKQARKLAYQQQIAEIAERLATAARQQDLWQLFATLCIGKRDGEAVRAHMVAHGTYTTVVDALLTAADHPHDRLRFLAAQAMDHFADQRCEEPLRRLMHDPVPRVRWAAIHSLGCEECKLAPLEVGGDRVASLIELALHDPSIRVRRVASYELANACADPRALAALERILAHASDPTIVRNVRKALERGQGV
jgi:hypothetical protein